MKILMVLKVFPPIYAGATVQGILLTKKLLQTGIDTEIVTNNFSAKSAMESFEGINVHKIFTFWKYQQWGKFSEVLFAWRVFIFCLRHPEFNIIFLHSVSGFDIFLLPLLKFLGRKTILELTLVGYDDPVSLRKRKLGLFFSWALRFADKIVAISSKLYDLTLQSGFPRDKIIVIPCGVDASQFISLSPSEKSLLRKKLGYPDDSKIFLAIGQIGERKGYEFMLRAWKLILMRFPNAVLLIAGPKNDDTNPYFLKLSRIIEEESLDGISFLGLIHNVSDYMQIADCLLHCATHEGLGIVFVEACFAHVPVVCRKIDGVTTDIFTDPQLGKECIGDQPQDFADLVSKVMEKQESDQQKKAVETLKQRFDIQAVAANYKNLFEELIAR